MPTDFDKARWVLADAAVLELRKGFDPEVYTLMMHVLGTRAQQDRWAQDRGHRWEPSGRFVPAHTYTPKASKFAEICRGHAELIQRVASLDDRTTTPSNS